MSNAAMPARVDHVRAFLDANTRSTRTANMFTWLILLVMIAMFSFTVWAVQTQYLPMTEPKTAIDTLEGQIDLDKMIKDYAQKARVMFDEEAPGLAKKTTVMMIENMPHAREFLETQTVNLIQSQVNKVKTEHKSKVRDYVRQNKGQIEGTLKRVANDPAKAEAEAELNSLMPVVEKELGGQVKSYAGDAVEALAHANAQVARLLAGKDLTSVEAEERQILMLAKRAALMAAAERPPEPPAKL